ncbi:MAG: arginine--tRNA ligase [Rhodospirillales bacterium]|jgi:arginyl-tRNA synthetase|nr:arginine--tRNA ligase [Rhodospirillales bacterium]HIJ43041.1 arginine--tRNA ligase [Rhodospirillaceae bacterium]MDP7216244.1 arginine--tRNA ligase [Rhodospirillales bacterium]HIJ44895.1 arginine--tRNA ligase [Rhodospirillaceae bacterium]HIJ92149.1 arginine--tRNA ligase [Rhodospirillaceae bacterium]
MNLFNHFRDRLIAIIGELAAEESIPSGLDTTRVTVEPPREESLGDITTNAAMILAKPAAMKPRDLAALLAGRLDGLDSVAATEIAGPGFINMRLENSFWRQRLAEILTAGPAYGDSGFGRGCKVNVEFVSTNPTGPLHVGHGRGAVVGDALASLLEKAGFDVTREYYVNDAGAQVEMLARSAAARAGEALGMVELDEEALQGLYPGEYLKPVGEKLASQFGAQRLNVDDAENLQFLVRFCIDEMLDLIRADLAVLGVEFDVFTSEKELVEAGAVDAALKFLAGRGLIYTGVLEPPKGKKTDDWEPRPQALFRATEFGDDVDRPLKKSDGSWTYFATDIAYHMDKFRRGFETMIDVWGADHGGYVKRMRAAVEAVTEGAGELDVKLCQMVKLTEGGQPVKMSKRAGAFVTLSEVIERVGRDVVRFIMLTRKNDAHLDFDLAKVTEQSRENPVFYVQYAHARSCSVLRHAAEVFLPGELSPSALARAELDRLTDPAELALIKVMASWPSLVESAALAHEPHRVAFYLNDLAARFHMLWNKGNENADMRFLIPGKRALSAARLALVRGTAIVIASGLKVMGVIPVQEMK